MIKVSKLTDYAVVVLSALNQGEALMAAPALARATGLPEPTVAKLLKLLSSSLLVKSSRGAGGGYRLTGALKEINIADVITAIDGPIALTACVDEGDHSCGFQNSCSVKGRWNQVNMAVNDALKNISLTDMIGGAT